MKIRVTGVQLRSGTRQLISQIREGSQEILSVPKEEIDKGKPSINGLRKTSKKRAKFSAAPFANYKSDDGATNCAQDYYWKVGLRYDCIRQTKSSRKNQAYHPAPANLSVRRR